jgi:hypothetical protein
MEKTSPLHSLILPGYVTENSLRGFLAARLGEGPSIGNSIAGTPKTVLDKLIADYDYLDGLATYCGRRAEKRHARANDEAYDALPTGSDPALTHYYAQKTRQTIRHYLK